MILLGLALAALIGASLGLLGGGGSILTVPIFVYILGMAPKPAIAMSLAVVGTTAAVGTISHWRQGHVVWRVAVPFALVAMVGTFLGARLATLVTGTVQLVLFAVVMLAMAVAMLRDRSMDAIPGTRRGGMALIAIEGLVVGVLTGLVGVGGGFLIVPALVLFARVPMKDAIGTSLFVIALKSFAGFAGYLDQVEVRWTFLAGFSAVAILGVLAGSRLARHVPAARLKRAFAVFLLVMGSAILIERTFG
ncbi:MAG: sulfite exporter TauE/SafE family protein [Gemmatimonadales bacterium]